MKRKYIQIPNKLWKQFVEDCGVPANHIGTGTYVAGLTGDPPVKKRRKIKIGRRKPM